MITAVEWKALHDTLAEDIRHVSPRILKAIRRLADGEDVVISRDRLHRLGDAENARFEQESRNAWNRGEMGG